MELKDPEEREKAVKSELKHYFKPEFINRLDDLIIFNPLGKEEIKQIVDIMLQNIKEKVKERDIEIIVTDAAKELIADAGFDPVYGARPLKRAIQEIIEDRLAELILEGKVKEGSRVTFDAKDGEIIRLISSSINYTST